MARLSLTSKHLLEPDVCLLLGSVECQIIEEILGAQRDSPEKVRSNGSVAPLLEIPVPQVPLQATFKPFKNPQIRNGEERIVPQEIDKKIVQPLYAVEGGFVMPRISQVKFDRVFFILFNIIIMVG